MCRAIALSIEFAAGARDYSPRVGFSCAGLIRGSCKCGQTVLNESDLYSAGDLRAARGGSALKQQRRSAIFTHNVFSLEATRDGPDETVSVYCTVARLQGCCAMCNKNIHVWTGPCMPLHCLLILVTRLVRRTGLSAILCHEALLVRPCMHAGVAACCSLPLYRRCRVSMHIIA